MEYQEQQLPWEKGMIAKGSDPSGMKVQVLLPGKIAQSPEVWLRNLE